MEPVLWIPGLDMSETGEALGGFEIVYQPQFPEISLQPFTADLFEAMLDPRIDYARTGRARMKELDRVVTNALRRAAEAGSDGSDLGSHLGAAIDLLLTRRQHLEDFASLPSRGTQAS
jgi:hypothetical protein